ncbi:MAG: alpha-L-arabinofuranosidase, partial [Muribaculaceae bacterium]|nr:alpha-L-arabinofuranosidase [Muribaculaceae bacterium]
MREDGGKWESVGDGYDFLKSDFGSWGAGKKMWNPQLFPTSGGWACLFRVTPDGGVMGLAESADLLTWRPQKYMEASDTSMLTFRTNVGFLPSAEEIDGKLISGNVMKTDAATVARLKEYVGERRRLQKLYSEHCDGDKERFAGLQPLSASITADGTDKEISPLLMGIFFEDINYSADGGLYGELVQNRDFEYVAGESRDKEWGPKYGWSVTGDKIGFSISTDNPIHANNPHFARLEVQGGIATLVNNGGNAFVNSGYDGIAVSKGEPYRLRLKARSTKKMPLEVNIISEHGRKVAGGKLKLKQSRDWVDYELILTPDE